MHTRKHFGPDDPAWDAPEAAWIAQMASGDPAVATPAMASLYAAYNGAIRAKLRWFRIDPQDINDVAQQVWVDLAKGAGRYPGDIPVHLFVFRYVDFGRRRYWEDRKTAPPPLTLSDEDVERIAMQVVEALFGSRTDAPHYLALAYCVRQALAAFERLHPRLASLLVSRHVAEYSLDEIAAALGDRPDAIKAQLFTARRKFEPEVAHCLDLWPDREPSA